MTEDDLIDLNFIKIVVPIRESGNEKDYHYYSYSLNPDISLVSTTNDDSGRKNWKVSVDYWGEIDNVEDILILISLFKSIGK